MDMSGRAAIDWFFPRTARRAVTRHAKRLMARPRIGSVRFGDLRRTSPICRDWGYSRGTPIDRYYIDRFLAQHAGDVRGHVLEVGTSELTHRFGGDRITRSDVLHVAVANPPITIVGDLVSGAGLPSGEFDCAIVTQTIQFIYDHHAVMRTLHRILRPGGVALVTIPGITKISPEDMDKWGQYWSYTSRSARQLFEEAFTPDDVTVEAAGNVLTAAAFLYGIASEELSTVELDDVGREHEVLIGVRARKGST
jgi:SAM-dependent methyltransferase